MRFRPPSRTAVQRDEQNTAGAPYQGVAATVPGVIEAEHFDYGGEGVGYSDSTSSNIPKVNESGEGGGYSW